ncbi:FKBP12-interacting protein of 37 kDa [Iris pallida]|uniref:FKBP12-interacting protein of 37 kDa n=1 Tax=Iris pallida TaxID=29817 RepID=A0AAX6IN88_IRIPA|nr:FKBP12-interacting protein of 37 kDa [Iris pallida]
MASQPHPDEAFPNQGGDLGGDFSGNRSSTKRSGEKRPFGDHDAGEDVFDSKKGKLKVEESGPGAATGMILSLRESLQNCKDGLATCQAELESAKCEITKWRAAFQDGPATPAGGSPEPGLVVTYLQNLKSSEESLKEKLEKAKKREAAFIVTYAKREQEIADLKSAVRDLKKQLSSSSIQTRKFLLDPAIHEEFMRLKRLVEEKEKKVKELQENVEAVNFTPNSRKGRLLMDKCKTLSAQNAEVGEMTSEAKIHELGTKITELKSHNAELRNQFDALSQHTDGLISDVDRSHEMVFLLQEKIEMKDYEIDKVRAELKRTKEVLTEKESKPEEVGEFPGEKEEDEAENMS